MPYAVDLTLHIAHEDISTGRLPERHGTREAAEAAGDAIAARFKARDIDASYDVQEVDGER